MEEYVVPIFLVSLAGTTLSLGAWVVRGVTRTLLVHWWGVTVRAEDPVAYWLLAAWHFAGLAIVIVVAVATTLYFLLDAFA